MNRMGMGNKESPFVQMSYETTMQFLTKSALYKIDDNMKSPSASICGGNVMHGGTGIFDVLQTV